MKEGIQTIDIEPLVGYLDFFGPAKEHTTTDNNQILKGNIILKLNKTMKVKTMTVKFTGHSQVHHYIKLSDQHPQNAISLPLLPKLKTKVLSKSTIFPVGDHVVPWELEIPNIYPRSFSSSKRGTIQYQVELKISLGINKKSLVAFHPVAIRRHLILSQELAASVPTNTYENTANKFRYEVEAPSIICIEQGYFPISVKCNKPVKFIYTQIIQTEIYRCRNISKAEADMAITVSKKNSTIIGGQTYDSFKNGESGLSKFFKRIQPVTLNTIDQDHQLLPLLLLHDLDSSLLTPGIESPLVAIYHQLEVIFNFGDHEHDEIRAKIPVLVSSVPDSLDKTRQKYEMEKQEHELPLSIEVVDTTLPRKKTTADEHTSIRDSLVVDDDKSIKKSSSDQNLQEPKLSEEIKRISMNVPPSIRPNMIDTSLASTLEASLSIISPCTPSRPMLMEPSSTIDSILQPPTETFVGLLPPPRRARKKESISEEFYKRTTSSRSSSTTRSSPFSSNSRPISPISLHHTPTEHLSFCESTPPLSPPPLSPPPSIPRNIRLNQSKSSCTNTPLDYPISRKRSNSTDEDYSKSIKSHYFCAELPPIPPAITRQKLPSIPTIEKEENRKTKMYYEDETDEEEEEEEIYNFFLKQL